MFGFSLAGIGFFGIISLWILLIIGIFIWPIIFWIKMFIHAASHPIENKIPWIVIMILFSFLGAVFYYFMVKRDFDKQPQLPTQT